MLLLISPAKRMIDDPDAMPPESTPRFLKEAEHLAGVLREKSPAELKALLHCSDGVARETLDRMANLDLRHGLTAALLSFDSVQYRFLVQAMATDEQRDYVRRHVRILSGLYGVLRPFDGVRPYRLDMQTVLAVGGSRNLYQFWGGRLAASLAAEDTCMVCLASKAERRAVQPHLPPPVRFVTCVFGETGDDAMTDKGALSQMARGRLVSWAAGQGAQCPEDLREFTELGYRYEPSRSDAETMVFLRGGY